MLLKAGKLELLILSLILLMGVFLRCINISDKSLSLDETISVTNAIGLHSEILPKDNSEFNSTIFSETLNPLKGNAIDDGGNGLTNLFSLKIWISFFGTSNLAIRSMGVVVFLLSSLAFIQLIKVHFHKVNLYIGSLLFVLHPLIVFHNTESRTYSLCILLSILLLYYFLNWLKSISNVEILKVLTLSVLGFFSHFTFSIFILVLFTYALYLRWQNKKALVQIISISLLFVIIVWVWYTTIGYIGLNSIAERNSSYQDIVHTVPESKTNFINLIKGFFETFLPFTGNNLKSIGFKNRIVIFASIPILFAIGYFIINRTIAKAKTPHLPFLSILILFPFLTAIISAISAGHITSFLPRYSVWFVPFFIIWILTLISSLKKAIKSSLILYVTLLFTISSLLTVHSLPENNISNKKSLDYLNKNKEHISSISFPNKRTCLIINTKIKFSPKIEQTIDTSNELLQLKMGEQLQMLSYNLIIK